MEAHTIEGIPEEVIALAMKHTFLVDVQNLDKRVRAMRDIFEAPKTDLGYARRQAEALKFKCISAGRGDLAAELEFIIHDPSYDEKRKARKEAIEATKLRFKGALGRM